MTVLVLQGAAIVEQLVALRDEEVRLREDARLLELDPASSEQADALFRRATAVRAQRMEILDEWGMR